MSTVLIMARESDFFDHLQLDPLVMVLWAQVCPDTKQEIVKGLLTTNNVIEILPEMH